MDTLQVPSADGTTSSIAVTIRGANEAPGVITGDCGSGTVNGTGQNNVIVPLPNVAIVNAGGGDDIIRAMPGDGADIYYGGSGSDTADYSAITSSVTVNLGTSLLGIITINGAGTASGLQIGTDLLVSIENVISGADNDTIDGRGGNDIIEGGTGNEGDCGGRAWSQSAGIAAHQLSGQRAGHLGFATHCADADRRGTARRLSDPRHSVRELHPPDHHPVDGDASDWISYRRL